MRIEHIGLNIPEPVKAAKWYIENLGMTIKSEMTESPYVYFLADSADNVMLEIYNNPAGPVPDYHQIHHLTLHIAFYTDDVEGKFKQLIEAGATPVGGPGDPDKPSQLAMVRDPWGFPIQLAKRAEPMV